MSILNTRKKIKSLERSQSLLLKTILDTQEMIKGTYGEAYRKCGKSTCRCIQDKGHPVNRITWSENGKTKTKSIPKKDLEWIKAETESYQIFRKCRSELRLLDNQLRDLLNELEDKIIIKTKKQKDYF